jgi:hypothetical protein
MRISCEGVVALGRFMISLAMYFGKEAATRNFVKIPLIFAQTDASTADTVRLGGVRTTRPACGHRIFIVQFRNDVSACRTHPVRLARSVAHNDHAQEKWRALDEGRTPRVAFTRVGLAGAIFREFR